MFFVEVMYDRGPHPFKIKVLRGDAPHVWATLTELATWSGKEYYILTALDDGRLTDVRFLGSAREEVGELAKRDLDALTRERTSTFQAEEVEAAAYFAKVVTEAYEAQRS